MKVALVLAVTLAVATAHVCMLFPRQRGPLQDLNEPGATDCIRLEWPCGKIEPGKPVVTFKQGANVSLVFQKNLNHWDQATPGSLNISIADSEDMKFRTIFMVADTNTSSLTLYTPYIILPMEKMDRAVMQLAYNTKNPNAPPVFYQCADISIQ